MQIIPVNIERPFRGLSLIGSKFGRLTVLNLRGFIRHKGSEDHRMAMWYCRCDCGKDACVAGNALTTGNTKSCGCLRVVGIVKHGYASGGGKHRLYMVWLTMRERCRNPHNESFPDYGGRGIYVCDRWQKFEAFLEDMGSTWKRGLKIERTDNNGPYCKENCYWATDLEQANNKRNNRYLSFAGERLTVAQWSRRTGLKSGLIQDRISRGWESDRVLSILDQRTQAPLCPRPQNTGI